MDSIGCGSERPHWKVLCNLLDFRPTRISWDDFGCDGSRSGLSRGVFRVPDVVICNKMRFRLLTWRVWVFNVTACIEVCENGTNAPEWKAGKMLSQSGRPSIEGLTLQGFMKYTEVALREMRE